MSMPRTVCFIVIAAVIMALPMILGNYLMSIVILALFYGYLALSWNIIGGIAGQLSLGHAAYFGIGAYCSTALLVHFGISPWLGMMAGAALAAAAALVIGLPCFRLRGPYYALATLAAAIILEVLVKNAHDFLGGPRGMSVPLLRDAPLYFQHTSKLFYYAIIVVFVVLALAINRWILSSRFGYYLTAIRNDQEAAAALGVDAQRYKLKAAVLSGAMTGIGGTFYAQYVLYISPHEVLGTSLSVQIAVLCIIGGRGTVWGPLLGALLLLPAEEVGRWMTGGMPGAAMMLYGILVMVVIRFMPGGLVELPRIVPRLQRALKLERTTS